MGYGNPLHGLDGNGERWATTGKGNEPTVVQQPTRTLLPVTIPALSDEQTMRALACQEAARLLHTNGRTASASEIMDVAEFILCEGCEPETRWRRGMGWLAPFVTSRW